MPPNLWLHLDVKQKIHVQPLVIPMRLGWLKYGRSSMVHYQIVRSPSLISMKVYPSTNTCIEMCKWHRFLNIWAFTPKVFSLCVTGKYALDDWSYILFEGKRLCYLKFLLEVLWVIIEKLFVSPLQRNTWSGLYHCLTDILTTDLANFPPSKVGVRCSSRRSSHGNDTWWHMAFLSVLEFLLRFVALKNNILGSRSAWRHHTFHQKFMKCQFVRNPTGTSYADESLSPFAHRLKASKTTCAWTRRIFRPRAAVLVGWLVMKNAYLGFQVYLM